MQRVIRVLRMNCVVLKHFTNPYKNNTEHRQESVRVCSLGSSLSEEHKAQILWTTWHSHLPNAPTCGETWKQHIYSTYKKWIGYCLSPLKYTWHRAAARDQISTAILKMKSQFFKLWTLKLNLGSNSWCLLQRSGLCFVLKTLKLL